MKKINLKKILFTLATSSTILASATLSLVACGTKVSTYSVEYNTPTGLTWTTKANAIQVGNDLSMTYTLATGYAVDADRTTITCNGSSIKNNVTYRYGTISINRQYINGPISINMVLKQVTTYEVSYNTDDTHLSWTEKPNLATEGATFTATFTLTKGWIVDTENSVVTRGEDEDITDNVTFSNGTVIVSGEYVTDKLNFKLVTKELVDDHETTEPVGGEITPAESASGLKTYTLKCNSSNGEMSITLKKNWLNTNFVITAAGTYNITLDNCNIYNMECSDQTTPSNTPSVFYINTKKGVTANVNFILATNSENSFNDIRDTSVSSYSEDFVVGHKSKDSTGSLNFTGTGILNINNVNNNKGINGKAIQTQVDMNVSNNATINAFAYDTCIQVGGKLIVEDANIIADSYNDDAIKNKALDPDKDLSLSNKNINRDIIVKGNSIVKTYSARNGISALHNFKTESTTNGSPAIEIYTGYANAGNKVRNDDKLDEQNMFIQVPSSVVQNYSPSDYYYTVDFYANKTGSESTGSEYLTLKKIVDNTGYFFKTDRPLSTDASYFKLNIYAKSEYGSSSPTITASSDYIKTIDSPTGTNNNDCVAISSISNSTITMSAYYLNNNYKRLVKGDETSIDTTIGSKGIKAKNEIILNAGDIAIKSVDTCVSASYGDMFCNTSTAGDVTFGTGNITLNGANINGYSTSADGIKAYGEMNVKSGEISIDNSVEALEAPVINVSGGITKLFAKDDGLNASTAGTHKTNQLTVNMTGGILDVQTGTGDCDSIDSNYTITITGGLLVSRVPGSGSAMTLDWESGNVSVTGSATVVLLGKTEADGMNEIDGPQPPGGNKSITTTGKDYTSSISTSVACASGNHVISYYNASSSSASSTYTYNNKVSMNSSKVRIWSCTGKVTIS